MAIKRKIIWRQVGANLNVIPTGQYGGVAPTSNNAAYDDLAIMDATLNAEARLWRRIAEARYNGNRTTESPPLDVIKTVNVNNGALIPHHMGPVIGVTIDGVAAELAPATAVAQLRSRNPLALKLAGRLYGLEDNRLYFTSDNPAIQATVYVFQFDRPEFANITEFFDSDSAMPSEYHQAWVDLATGYVMSREGHKTQAAGVFRGMGDAVAVGELGQEQRLRAVSADSQKVGE
jgi:hypothetical protein